MIAPKFKKQVGFIKSQSSKKLIKLNSRVSEDSFSSFQGTRRADGSDQFSPYKHPDHSRRKYVSPKHLNLPSPKQGSIKNREVLTQNINTRNEYTSHQPQGDNFFKEFQQNKNKLKQTIKEEILQVQKICRNIDEKFIQKRADQRVDKIEQNVERMPRKYPPKQTNNFIAKNASRQKLMQNQKLYDKYTIEKEYAVKSKSRAKPTPLSSDSESQNDQLKYTREQIRKDHKVTGREKPYNFESNEEEQYSIKEDDQELVMDYDKKEFVGGKSLKRAIMENVRPECRTEGMYQTKGGVCFDLDVNEFHSPAIAPPRVEIRPAKRVDPNSREEILKRRQMAKVYDRNARYKIFGFN